MSDVKLSGIIQWAETPWYKYPSEER
uniref:Uncharacterized protein n=1 Tax=Anguilla anguilla TaxID=7936 RepID=A0A0E9R877_ANGAN